MSEHPTDETDPAPTDAEGPAADPTGWRVLVPIAVLEGETVPGPVAELLGTLPVVLLGYHVVPEQTAPGQARLQFEERAQDKLEAAATAFREAGGDCDTRLVFTQNEQQTVDRIADETGCEAVLLPNPSGEVTRLLVPLGGSVNAARVADFVAVLVDGRDVAVTLLHVVDGEEGREAGEQRLAGPADRLREAGIDVTSEVVVDDSSVEAIAAAAIDHDAVVMGESEPSLRSFVFGESGDRVAERSVDPVIVVRGVRGTDEARAEDDVEAEPGAETSGDNT